jgi:ketosteroid isomerase-like protein
MEPDAYRELIQRGWTALSRHDPDAHLAYYDSEVTFRPALAVGGGAGWLHGHEGMRQAIENVYDSYETWSGLVEQFIAVGENALAIVRVDARGRASGVELSRRLGQVCTIRGDRILRLMNFLDLADAFEEMARLVRESGH